MTRPKDRPRTKWGRFASFKRSVLNSISQGMNLYQASKKAHVSPLTIQRWLRDDPNFVKSLTDATLTYIDFAVFETISVIQDCIHDASLNAKDKATVAKTMLSALIELHGLLTSVAASAEEDNQPLEINPE